MSRDWADSDYERVYHYIVDDPKMAEVWGDDALLAWWLRLLVGAGQSFPVSQDLPRRLPEDVLARLVDLGVIRLAANDRYIVAGMAKEREGRKSWHQRGGQARAASAVRDSKGHFTSTLDSAGPSKLDQHSSPALPASKDKQELSKDEQSKGTSRARDDDDDPLNEATNGLRVPTPAQEEYLDKAFRSVGKFEQMAQTAADDPDALRRAVEEAGLSFIPLKKAN